MMTPQFYRTPGPFSVSYAGCEANDNDARLVLGTYPDRITFSVFGSDYLEEQYGRTFRPDEVERADLYACGVAIELSLILDFYFAPEVRQRDGIDA